MSPYPLSPVSTRRCALSVTANVFRVVARAQADLAGIEQIVRIEHVLDLLQNVETGAEFALHPRIAEQAGAMMVRDRAAMIERQPLHRAPQLLMHLQRLVV